MSSTVEQTETATRPHRRPRRALIALAVAVVGALALAGCYSAGQQQDMDLVNSYRRATARTGTPGSPARTGSDRTRPCASPPPRSRPGGTPRARAPCSR